MNILVTAIGGGGHGEQVLKALSMVGNADYRIFGADMNPNCPQKNLTEGFEILPSANSEPYLKELIKVLKRLDINVLIHGCEPELRVFSKHRELFKELGILVLINNSEIIDLCMNKVKTNEKLQFLGFNPPKYIELNSIYDMSLIDWYPVVVKPSYGGGGSADVFICQSRHELENLAEYLHLEDDGKNFMVQEYVGTADEEYTVGVLSDLNGNFINSIAVKRLMSGQLNIRSSVLNRSTRQDLGKKLVISSGVSQGHVGKFPVVTSQCEDIARQLSSTGPLNIQCRLVKGEVKVFEINPRFSGTTSLRAMVGFNEPDLLIRKHLLGQEIETGFQFDSGLIIRTLQENRVSD